MSGRPDRPCLSIAEFAQWCCDHACDVIGLGLTSHEKAKDEHYWASYIVAEDEDGQQLQCGYLEWRPKPKTMDEILTWRDQLLAATRRECKERRQR